MPLHEVCSRCGNTFLACDCDNYYPPVLKVLPTDVILSASEAKDIVSALNYTNNPRVWNHLSPELRAKLRGRN